MLDGSFLISSYFFTFCVFKFQYDRKKSFLYDFVVNAKYWGYFTIGFLILIFE